MHHLRRSLAPLLLLLGACAPEAPRPIAGKAGAAGDLVVLTAANFDKEVLQSKTPVLVDVGAPN